MSQKIVTISMQNSEGNGFGDPWQILSSTFLKSSVFCYVELTLIYRTPPPSWKNRSARAPKSAAAPAALANLLSIRQRIPCSPGKRTFLTAAPRTPRDPGSTARKAVPGPLSSDIGIYESTNGQSRAKMLEKKAESALNES